MGKKIETNEEVVLGYLKLGMKQRDIAEKLGVSRSWVALFARLNGLSRPKVGRPSTYDFVKIEQDLSNGKTYQEIAKEMNKSHTAVYAAMRYRKKKQTN